LTSEQLEASRVERMRLNGSGVLTLEDARTWLEETGLCLFMPRRQYPASLAPSFVEAVAGQPTPNPDPKQIAHAEELLVRLERDDIAVRLNLLGQPGEHPDFVVAAWVLPYVYALRGDRDWRRSPQLTGSRQVSPLAIQAYKLLEGGETSIPQLKHTLGREVTEAAVTRAITELWQQLRIVPIIAAPGQTAKWQLLRVRFQKAIAEGASTSQVTAISVLASIYLQAVIAANMEDVELFLAPLTARSKVREVIRGLVATRQVHSMSLGHSPHFYVAGTLPEFALPQTAYASSYMPSSYFQHTIEREEEPEVWHAPMPTAPAPVEPEPVVAESLEHQAPAPKPAARHFSRPSIQARDRKPSQSSNGRTRHASSEARGPRHAKHAAKHAPSTSSHRPHSASASTVRSSRTQPTTGARKAAPAGRAIAAGKPTAKSTVSAHAKRPRTVAAGAKSGSSKRFATAQRTKKRG
jgi:23S rRNA pseudouridine2605 synthase